MSFECSVLKALLGLWPGHSGPGFSRPHAGGAVGGCRNNRSIVHTRIRQVMHIRIQLVRVQK